MLGYIVDTLKNKLNYYSSIGGLFFLMLLLATFLNEHINAIRNIGLYSTSIMIVIYSATRSWRPKDVDGYGVALILLTILILQGVVRNEYGIAEGFDTFRRTYFKAYVLAIGIMFFVQNSRAVSMVMWSLAVAVMGVLSNGVYMHIFVEDSRFFYSYLGSIHQSAHFIDFVDSVAVVFTRHEARYARYIAVVVLITFTVLVIATGSRGGWLAFVAGFIVTYFLINTDRNVVLTVVKSSIRVAVVVVGVYVVAPTDSYVHHKFNSKFESPMRTEVIYPVYLQSIVSGPLFGHGYTNNIEDRIPNNYGIDQNKFDAALKNGPHNQFLIFGVHFGLIGVLAYLIVVMWTLYRLVSRALYSSDMLLRLLSAAGAGMLVAEYIVRSITDPVFKHWIGVPIGIALIRLTRKD